MSNTRTMVFIDGENLTMRYQAMLSTGLTPSQYTVHIPNVFAWNKQALNKFGNLDLIRVTYYTYAVGTDEQLDRGATKMKESYYATRPSPSDYSDSGYLYPKVFKKNKQSAKRKGVDISIAVDSLTHVFGNSIDIVYLITGDGD